MPSSKSKNSRGAAGGSPRRRSAAAKKRSASPSSPRRSARLAAAGRRRLQLRGGAAALWTPCSPHAGALRDALDAGRDVTIGDVVFATGGLSPDRRAAGRTQLDAFTARVGCAGAANECPPFRLHVTESDASVVRCNEKAFRVPCGTRILDILRGLRERSVVEGVDYGDLSASQHAALADAVASYRDTHGVVGRVVVLVWPSGKASLKACAA